MNLRLSLLILALLFGAIFFAKSKELKSSPISQKNDETEMSSSQASEKAVPEIPFKNSPTSATPPSAQASFTAGHYSSYDYNTQNPENFFTTPPPLLDNWDFRGTPLNEADMAAFMTQSQPARIVYFGEQGAQIIEPLRQATGAQQSPDTWYVGQSSYANKLAEEKKQEALAAGLAQNSGSNPQAQTYTHSTTSRLGETAFEVVSFKAGQRNDGSSLTNINSSLENALQGPDYNSTEEFDWKNDNIMRAHLSKLMSFGYGGELTLKIAADGYLNDEAGFDFALFSNVFIYKAKIIAEDFAEVGVSNTPDAASFKWFPCRPNEGNIKYCAGAIPTSMGGDQFDLAVVGLKQIRYIKIRDLSTSDEKRTGNNSKWPTEGFDLDALRIFHAYTDSTTY